VDHPYQEVPCLEEGIPYHQAESRQVGLGAGIQEEGFVEEAAYLEAYLCKKSVGELKAALQYFLYLPGKPGGGAKPGGIP